MKKDHTCTIIVERQDINGLTTTLFSFDDIRIAVAVENILHNIDSRYMDVKIIRENS